MELKLSASNIAWTAADDERIFCLLQEENFSGLEIAPTRIIPDAPYDHLDDAKHFAENIKREYGLCIPSMQSIWFGVKEKITESKTAFDFLFRYTQKALQFADAVQCRSLVFGCPKNRTVDSPAERRIVTDFLLRIAREAEKYGLVIALEANPVIYHTNYANTTAEAISIIEAVHSPTLKLNFDFGTFIYNDENFDAISSKVHLISHVHISTPGLENIETLDLHKELISILKKNNYAGFISLERKTTDYDTLKREIEYLKTLME